MLYLVGRSAPITGHHALGDIETHGHAESAYGGHVVDFEGGYASVAACGQARLDPMLSSMRVRNERLQAIGAELDRPRQQPARRRHGKLFRVDIQLHAESAAYIRGNDAHAVLRYAQMTAEDVLHLKRRLMRVIHKQRL